MTATHVSASVNSARIPATASQAARSRRGAEPHEQAHQHDDHDRDRVGANDVSTCAQSTDGREIGMEWNRSKIPLCRSVNSRTAV